MASYFALLAVALVFNLGDKRMFMLSAIVGIGVFAPVPDANFYLICALGEILIGLFSLRLNTRASHFVAALSAMLVAFHFMGWHLNGYPINSPYHSLVKISEHAELIACIVLSKPILRLLTNAARIY